MNECLVSPKAQGFKENTTEEWTILVLFILDDMQPCLVCCHLY